MATESVKDTPPRYFQSSPSGKLLQNKGPKYKPTQFSKTETTKLKAATVAKQLDRVVYSNAASCASEDTEDENEEVAIKSKSPSSPSVSHTRPRPLAWHSVSSQSQHANSTTQSSEKNESEESEDGEQCDFRSKESRSGLLNSKARETENSEESATLKECQNRMARKMNFSKLECEYQIIQLTMMFHSVKNYQPSPEESYSMPLDVMAKIISRVKDLNQTINEDIDAHFNQKSDYYFLTQTIEKDFKNYIQNISSYYLELKKIHRDFPNAKEGPINLYAELGNYLKKDKNIILNLEAFEKNTFLKLSFEKRKILSSLIHKHIMHQYSLDKIWVKERAMDFFLDEASEEQDVSEESGSGSDATEARCSRTGFRLSTERTLLERLLSKIHQRIQMRHGMPSFVEQSRVDMLTKWIELINKVERS